MLILLFVIFLFSKNSFSQYIVQGIFQNDLSCSGVPHALVYERVELCRDKTFGNCTSGTTGIMQFFDEYDCANDPIYEQVLGTNICNPDQQGQRDGWKLMSCDTPLPDKAEGWLTLEAYSTHKCEGIIVARTDLFDPQMCFYNTKANTSTRLYCSPEGKVMLETFHKSDNCQGTPHGASFEGNTCLGGNSYRCNSHTYEKQASNTHKFGEDL